MTSPDPLAGRHDAECAPSTGTSVSGPAAESAVSLTNQGWAALEQGEPQQAMQHFRRALRLRPNHAQARSGIVEALKAHHPLYRWVLGWFFWIARFPPSTQIAVMLIAFLALRFIGELARIMPQWGPLLWPVIIVCFALCILGGLASPLFDVILRLDPVGQKSLNEDQRRGANLLLWHLLLPLPLLFWFLMTSNGLGIVASILLMMSALSSSSIFRCAAGWPRWTMIAITLTVLGMIAPLLLASLQDMPGWLNDDRSTWIWLCVYALIVAQLAATALLAVRTNRAA